MVGTIASRSNSETFAPTAFEELSLAVSLFERSSAHYVVRTGLVSLFFGYDCLITWCIDECNVQPILLRLRDKALQQRESRSATSCADASSKTQKKDSASTPMSEPEVKEELIATD